MMAQRWSVGALLHCGKDGNKRQRTEGAAIFNDIYPLVIAGDLAALVACTLLAGLLARRGFPTQDPARRIGSVDGLRGYLALAVMLSHAHRWLLVERFDSPWAASVAPLSELGGPAVALFFMTTGLVFYPRILAGLTGTNWLTVAITRVFRLVPLIIASVLVVLVILMIRRGALPDAADARALMVWISSWAEPPLLGYEDAWRVNAAVLWSLRLEWLFYILVLPAAAAMMQVMTRLGLPSWLVIGGSTAAALLAIPLVRGVGIQEVNFYLPFMTLFAAGMVAHEFHVRPAITAFLAGRAMSFVAALALVLGVYLWQPWETVSVVAIGLLLVFFICVVAGNSIFGLLKLPGALVLGECSFGIYLVHGIVLFVFFDNTRSVLADMPATSLTYAIIPLAGVAVLVAASTHLAIERPFIAMGRTLARKAKGRPLRLDRSEVEVAP